jgi:plastocyanin
VRRAATSRFLRGLSSIAGLCLCCSAFQARGQQSPVAGQPVAVQIDVRGQKPEGASGNAQAGDAASNVAVWLVPVDVAAPDSAAGQKARLRSRLTQRNKNFEPHLLVVEVGTTIDFPNRDPFFHNVFSLFDGKRFDLGLYEAGATNSARFDRVGVSFLFCNIHPEMSAVIVAVNTPYFAVTDRSGRATLANVPDGRYEMHVWSERGVPEDLKNQTRAVTISTTSRTLPAVRLLPNPNFNSAHKNKYGQDYVPPPDTSYIHP